MATQTKKISEFFKERNRINYQSKDVILVVVDDLKKLPIGETLKLDKIFILLCSEGYMELNVNGKAYEVAKDDMFICPPNVCIDELKLSPDFKFKMLGLSYIQLQKSLHINKEIWDLMMYVVHNPLFHLSKEDVQLIESYYALAQLKLKYLHGKFDQEIIFSLLQTVYYELLAIISRTITIEIKDDELNRADQLFRKFLELLSESGGKERTVSEFAQKMCITPKYLSTITKEASGKSAMSWIHEYTIDAIVQKLKYSEMSIKEIAAELNFSNISFFGKFVKAHLGMPPKEYRRQIGRAD